MSGLVSALADCAQLLADWNERAAIVGGVAFVARVRGRLTEDIDVAVVVPNLIGSSRNMQQSPSRITASPNSLP